MKEAESLEKLLFLLSAGLGRSLSSMTGKEFVVSSEGHSAPAELDRPSVWQQSFSVSAAPVLWISAGKDLWTAVARMTLAAVGMDDPSDEDCRSTWQEILSQSTGAFATALSAEMGHEVTASSGEEIGIEPPDLVWTAVEVRCEESVWYVKTGWAKSVPSVFAAREKEPEQRPATAPKDSNFSKTFDLLLDVALPVAVSFGKTSLQIREVLKLNTGSIVELNRFVVEPVDVIVNDCVIARGEVVVVDGNYGVRITQLASREDRLRTGIAEAPVRAGASSK